MLQTHEQIYNNMSKLQQDRIEKIAIGKLKILAEAHGLTIEDLHEVYDKPEMEYDKELLEMLEEGEDL